MSKILKSNVKVVKKFHLKRRLELKLTAFVVKNLCPNFQNLAPPGKFRVGGAGVSLYEITLILSNIQKVRFIMKSKSNLTFWDKRKY